MLLTDTGFELVEHLERQKDIPSLLASFQRLVLAFGMDCFCVGDASHPKLKSANGRWGGTWPAAWTWRYARHNNWPDDPVVARMAAQTAPFRWSDTFAGLDAGGQRVLDDARAFGMTNGFAVPIHQPDGTIAGVSIAAASYELSPRDEIALHMSSLYLHAKLAGLRAAAAPPAPRLAPRERECLKWVAAGKTDWEISQILNISEQTAHGYVQNALVKLGARTRAQAVARAMLSAQIQQ